MPIMGFVRNRRHLFGRQSVIGTKVPAVRQYGFSGVPAHGDHWTDPEVDAGSIDIVADPIRVAPNPTAPLTDNAVKYNDLPIMLSAILGGAETAVGAGTAKTWTWLPASDGSDAVDTYTYQFGDDVDGTGGKPADWFQYGGGVLNSLEFTGPEGLGAVTASMAWQFGSISSTGSTDFPATGTVPTPGLTLPLNEAVVYLKDCGLYLASDEDYLDSNLISDALHTFTLRITQAWDAKRFADADQSFEVDAYGRGDRLIELVCTFAKTADTVGLGSESDAWFSEDPVTRYAQLVFTSKVVAEAGVPDVYNSWETAFPMRYYTRVEGSVGGNTTVVLTGRAFLESVDFGGVFRSTVVNTLASADL